MHCLIIDTSSKFLSVVIARDDCVLAKYNRVQERVHNQRLIPAVENVLRRSACALKSIDYLGVNKGPGSFTGLRIGLAAVKGLGLALGKPVISFSSLDLIAFTLKKNNSLICPIIDAKRNQVYSALYRSVPQARGSIQRIGKYFLGTIAELLKKLKGPVIFSGDALAAYREQIEKNYDDEKILAPQRFWYPRSDALTRLCFFLYKKKKFENAADIVPLYLYKDTCTVKRKS